MIITMFSNLFHDISFSLEYLCLESCQLYWILVTDKNNASITTGHTQTSIQIIACDTNTRPLIMRAIIEPNLPNVVSHEGSIPKLLLCRDGSRVSNHHNLVCGSWNSIHAHKKVKHKQPPEGRTKAQWMLLLDMCMLPFPLPRRINVRYPYLRGVQSLKFYQSPLKNILFTKMTLKHLNISCLDLIGHCGLLKAINISFILSYWWFRYQHNVIRHSIAIPILSPNHAPDI